MAALDELIPSLCGLFERGEFDLLAKPDDCTATSAHAYLGRDVACDVCRRQRLEKHRVD